MAKLLYLIHKLASAHYFGFHQRALEIGLDPINDEARLLQFGNYVVDRI